MLDRDEEEGQECDVKQGGENDSRISEVIFVSDQLVDLFLNSVKCVLYKAVIKTVTDDGTLTPPISEFVENR